MIVNSFFIAIPAGALCCFLFLLFCFVNMQKSKLVVDFRLILGACILWSGGATFMRLQLKPGGHFWFQVSLLGLLLLPVAMYFFLIQILEHENKIFLSIIIAVTLAVVAVNAATAKIVPTPIAVLGQNQIIGYTYTLCAGIYLMELAEFLFLMHITFLVHKRMAGSKDFRRKLFPLLFGIMLVYFGQLFEMYPGNIIPFGSLGGVLMALCFVYVLYQQSLFDISDRLLVGCVYTVAAILVALPVWNFSKNIEAISRFFSMEISGTVFFYLLLMTFWSLLVLYLAWKTAERLSFQKKREQFGYLHDFQGETASLFNEDELYKKIIEVMEKIFPDAHTLIFIRKKVEDDFLLVPTCEADYGLNHEEKERILSLCRDNEGAGRLEAAPLRYDDALMGFLYLMFPSKAKINYIEAQYFNQIAAYASICLKNINAYQEVYQISIHDDLTGLYNRTYYEEFLEKYWMPYDPQSLLFVSLDDFKLYSEMYGEETGDEIIKWCGQMILKTVGVRGATFRVGLNEFLVYSRYRAKDELLEMAHEIQGNILKEGTGKPKIPQPLTMSIGMALYPDTASDRDELLRQAEQAAFFAKWHGRNYIMAYEAAGITRPLWSEGSKEG